MAPEFLKGIRIFPQFRHLILGSSRVQNNPVSREYDGLEFGTRKLAAKCTRSPPPIIIGVHEAVQHLNLYAYAEESMNFRQRVLNAASFHPIAHRTRMNQLRNLEARTSPGFRGPPSGVDVQPAALFLADGLVCRNVVSRFATPANAGC